MIKRLKTVFFLLTIGAAFVAPIVVYAYQFGIGIWEEHSKWAEMGSALSGIYSPLIAFLAFLILLGQARMQAAMNKHQYDQAFIQANKDEVHFFAEKISSLLDETDSNGIRVRTILSEFSRLSEDELKSETGKAVAQKFTHENQQIFDLWLAVYPCLIGLGKPNEFPYEHNYSGAILKITGLLSLESCIALDKIYYAIDPSSRGKLKFWERRIT